MYYDSVRRRAEQPTKPNKITYGQCIGSIETYMHHRVESSMMTMFESGSLFWSDASRSYC